MYTQGQDLFYPLVVQGSQRVQSLIRLCPKSCKGDSMQRVYIFIISTENGNTLSS
jgi:hypothetical protein